MRVLLHVALSGAVLFLIPAAVRADDATSLLAKHRAFAGWSAASGVAWHASGTRSDGPTTDAFSESRRGLIFRDTLTSADGHLSIQNGFTGRAVWKTNENANFVAVLGHSGRVAIDRDAILGEATTDMSGASGEGSATVRGAATTIVRLSPAAGLPMDLYVDPQTGAYLRAVIDPQGEPQTIDITRYGSLGSDKKFAAAYDYDGKHYDLAQVDASKPVADADLLPPTATSSWTFAAGAVPLDMFSLGGSAFEPRVHASVNGHPGTFLL
nr:hypothetical protein [Candidatus Eremiobacteraeota bacterium]